MIKSTLTLIMWDFYLKKSYYDHTYHILSYHIMIILITFYNIMITHIISYYDHTYIKSYQLWSYLSYLLYLIILCSYLSYFIIYYYDYTYHILPYYDYTYYIICYHITIILIFYCIILWSYLLSITQNDYFDDEWLPW